MVSESYYLGAYGMPGRTAYYGLIDRANIKQNQNVFVSGAAGAVGSGKGPGSFGSALPGYPDHAQPLCEPGNAIRAGRLAGERLALGAVRPDGSGQESRPLAAGRLCHALSPRRVPGLAPALTRQQFIAKSARGLRYQSSTDSR